MSRVKTGLEQFIDDAASLGDKRVGLVTHPASVLRDYTHSADALLRAGINLVALFGPEHGLSGATADGVKIADSFDAHTGLPVFSLYGTTKEPTSTMVQDVDVLVFDMQDVGVRFYTFISTLFYILREAANVNLPVIVLDRPNPINGIMREGPQLKPGFTSFVGIAPIPLRYGLTIGELARYWNAELTLNANLTVVSMSGWRRALWFDETGLPWIPTSPAMPHMSTALVYPGMCLLEGTNISEGRGTALPFEVCGAPWIDGHTLAQHLNNLDLPGVRFRPTEFVPTASKFSGKLCRGVQVHVVQRTLIRPLAVGLHLLAALKTLYPQHFAWLTQSWEGTPHHVDLLMGTDQTRLALDAGYDVNSIVASWEADLTTFAEASRPYQRYR